MIPLTTHSLTLLLNILDCCQEMIEQGFVDCEKMGVTGSPWRLYVEPNTKEIFYHNFDTDEQLTWGNIEDKDYQRIYLADVFGAR